MYLCAQAAVPEYQCRLNRQHPVPPLGRLCPAALRGQRLYGGTEFLADRYQRRNPNDAAF